MHTDHLTKRFWAKVDASGGAAACWPWRGAVRGAHRYGNFNLGGLVTGAHRASWMIVNGPIPSGLCVLHRCDNPPCVNPAHLFLGSHADNVRDMFAKGRGYSAPRDAPSLLPRGEAHYATKLTEEQVRRIRQIAGLTQVEIAALFGVRPGTIGQILRGERWVPVT